MTFAHHCWELILYLTIRQSARRVEKVVRVYSLKTCAEINTVL